MSRLAQLGVFTSVLGLVTMFAGLFPRAMDVSSTPTIGLAQILFIMTGLTMLTSGAFLFVYAMWHRGQPGTLSRDIGLRMGLTGLTFAIAASLADAFGYGSHSLEFGIVFGRLQATGTAIGFLIASAGVFVYGIRRDRNGDADA